MTTSQHICQLGLDVIETELNAITQLRHRIDANFASACDYLLHCSGRIIVTGMGKSGHIGGKIASTLASTGSPAFFVHPGEASHGDMGMITKRDVVLAISYSGKTPELLTIIPLIKRLNIPLISLTGHPESKLATQSTVHLDVSIKEEACPLGLAPTASTTTALVMGDALAIALLQTRGFTKNDFALSHPGGALGRRLLLHVGDIMRTGNAIPSVLEEATIDKALIEMTEKNLGVTTVIAPDGCISGVFTDGDLRRALEKGCMVRETKMKDVMTSNYKKIADSLLAVEAVALLEQFKISSLLVFNEADECVGIIHMHDLLSAGVV